MPHLITDACTGCTVCARLCPTRAIRGEKGARHSIEETRCVDCGACGRSCPAGAILDEDRVPVAREKRSDRKLARFRLDACIGCGTCAEKCPARCIDMDAGASPGGSDDRPRLAREEACVACGWCVLFCPAGCVVLAKREAP